MVRIALGFLSGVLLTMALPQLPGVWIWVFLPVALVGLLWRPVFRLPAAALLGLCWSIIQAQAALNPALPSALEGRDLVIEARIASVVEQYPDKARFLVTPERLIVPASRQPLPARIRLNWYHNPRSPKPGELWRFEVRLKRPHGFSNPGGFDYEKWLFSQRIRATGYVRRGETAQRLAAGSRSIDGFRQRLAEALDAHLPPSEAALTKALALGIRSGLTTSQWETLIRTGVNHLVAISGLHIGFVAGLMYWLVRRLWSMVPGLCLRWPAQKAAALASVFPAMGYAALAGFSIPTQRALVMLIIAVSSVFLKRRPRQSTIFAGALLAVLLFDSLAVLSAGFWLSFGAVLVILWSVTNGGPSRVPAAIRIQWLIVAALTPVTLWFFGQASLVAPLANLVAIPLVALVAVPLLLVGIGLLVIAAPLGWFVIHLSGLLLTGWMAVMGWLAQFPVAAWQYDFPSTAVLFAALMAVALLVSFRGLPGRWLGLVLIVPPFYAVSQPIEPGGFVVTVLDVGEGLSTVVRTRDHLLVFDTGDRFSRHFNAADAVVRPFLRAVGRERIDVLILSHSDRDHAGAAGALLNRVPVERKLASFSPAGLGTGWQRCRAGQHWRWDGVDFEVLNPPLGQSGSENNLSCVVLVSNGRSKMLLTGDIEAETERRLVSRDAARLQGAVLQVPHHGSATSSSKGFLDVVRLGGTVISVGYRNRYGFPRREVMARYRERGIPLLRTDRDGAVSVFFSPQGSVWVETWRAQHRPFWSSHR